MFDSMGSILEALSPEQQIACSTQNNILLTACPGSGKTRTLTHRLAYQVLRDPASKKIKIAITYTNRAAEEITNRLEGMNIDQSSIWAGTIHQFCMHFIIRPYAMYSKRLCKGYRIIDDYSKKAYGREIAERLGMHLNYYDDPFQYENVRTEYKRVLKEKKEIDFDAILLISEELLASCAFIGSNIASVISSILVDEFQDTNELQYSILSTIYKANKSIILMFVGDVNQAIYSSLGGVAKGKKELETLYEINFDSLSLKGCYRSTQRLVDLYSRFEISKTDAHSVAKYKDEHGEIHFFDSVYYTDLASKIAALIKKELRKGTKAEEICVIAPQWFMLFDLSGKLRLLLPDISFDAPDISPIKYNPMNPLFLIAKLLFMPAGKNVKLRKRIAIEFISIIRDDFRIMVPDDVQSYDVLSAVNCCRHIDADGITCLEAAIEKVFALLNIRISKEASLSELKESFFDEIQSRVKKYSLATDFESISKYFGDKNGVVISTLHGVKGEEYTTVIAAGLLNGYLPHWDYIMNPTKKLCRRNETCKLLYVLCSRAKKNLYLFSECGRTTKSGSKYSPTDELSLIADII